MSTGRKPLKITGRTLGVWLWLALLCLGAPSCISPDLEPPGQGSTATFPSAANTAQQGAAGRPSTAGSAATMGGAATAPGVTATTEAQRPNTGAAGQPATASPAVPAQPGATPAGTAGASGTAGAGAIDQDADAGADMLP